VAAGIKNSLLAYTDSMAQVINQSQIKNFSPKSSGGAGWVINQHVYNEITLYSTYQEGVNYLKTFIDKHADYLTTTFAARAGDDGNDDDDDNPPPVVEEPPVTPFVPDEAFYYRIMNKGSNKLFDIENEALTNGSPLVMWSALPDRATQQWAVDSVAGSNGTYVRILNAASGLALTDKAEQNGTSYLTGAQVQQMTLDSLNDRQVWQLAPLRTGGLYALINKQTDLALNNSGGSQADGNRVISYTNDGRNEESANRQWYLEKTEMRPVVVVPEDSIPEVVIPEDSIPEVVIPEDTITDGLTVPYAPQYAVLYNPDTQTIRFVAEATHVDAIQALPDTEVRLYNTAGLLLRTFRSATEEYIGNLPPGTYILSWHDSISPHSVKFVK
jgi:hypothetical protein